MAPLPHRDWRNTSCFKVAWMKPHKPSPDSRKIDVDISEILLPPGNIRLSELSNACADTFPKKTASRLNSLKTHLSPSAWMNINFVAVSCLIALFGTLLIRDSFEYSRRQAHLLPDAADLKPEFNSTRLNGFSLEPSRPATVVQLDRSSSKLEDSVPYRNLQPILPAPAQPFQPDQALGPLANNNSLADRTTANNSSPVSSDLSGPARLSRTTTSSAENSGAGDQTSSTHSSMSRSIRRSRRSSVSSRATVSSHRQDVRHSLANRIRNSEVAKSGLQTTRQNLNGMTGGNRHVQANPAKTQMSAAQGLMSMHSLGIGNAAKLTHGAMSPMHMESGMLAQPGIGAGLGGIAGNGLGGGGGAHVGNRVAK